MNVIFFLIALFFSVQVSAATLNKVVVFGDSLSDNGNLYEYMKRDLPLSPPYYKGRFSNGPVWIEILTDMYYPENGKDHLLDYAFGGAGVSEEIDDDDDGEDVLFTLRREVDSYLISHHDKADVSSLYVIWMGSNNYLAVPDDKDGAVDATLTGIKHDIERLKEKGAKHFLIVNLPDLGRTPAAKDFDAVDVLTEMSLKHNDLLKKMIEKMKQDDPSVTWHYYSVEDMFGEAMDYPERFGFTNTTETCYEQMVNVPSDKSVLRMVAHVKPRFNSVDACTGFLFFDPVHPSALAHVILANRVKKLLDEEGVVFG